MEQMIDQERRRVRGLIAQVFLTSLEFSRALRVHPSKVSRYLRGHIELTGEEKETWAQTLGRPVNQVFGD